MGGFLIPHGNYNATTEASANVTVTPCQAITDSYLAHIIPVLPFWWRLGQVCPSDFIEVLVSIVNLDLRSRFSV